MTVKSNLPDYSNLVELAIERAEDVIVANVKEEAVRTSPVDTGEYRRKIVPDFQEKEVRAEAKYSKALEYGLPQRTITPKNAKALKFDINGQTVFSKSATLPATKPQSIMRNAGRKVQKDVGKIFNRELNKLKG